MLKVGDTVVYDTFTTPRANVVESISRCKSGDKTGEVVDSCDLDSNYEILVTFKNNHWCHKCQITNIIPQ